MKLFRVITIVVASLIIGILVGRMPNAQATDQIPAKDPKAYDFGTQQQLLSFLAYLKKNEQTEILWQFKHYSSANLAAQNYADLGVTLAVLRRLRDGRINEADDLLEERMNTDLMMFAASYRELPKNLQEQSSMVVLKYTKDYRSQFPYSSTSQKVNEGVKNAFKILNETDK